MLQDGKVLGSHLYQWDRSSRLWRPTFISSNTLSINFHVDFNLCACNKPYFHLLMLVFRLKKYILVNACGWWYPRFKDLGELQNKHVFIFFYVDLTSNLVLRLNMWRTIRTFKSITNVQTYSRNLHNHWQALIIN